MKIIWFCIPAHGHTNPTLGLVKALTDKGHTIYYFSYEMFREKIESAGAVFFPCDDYNFNHDNRYCGYNNNLIKYRNQYHNYNTLN